MSIRIAHCCFDLGPNVSSRWADTIRGLILTTVCSVHIIHVYLKAKIFVIIEFIFKVENLIYYKGSGFTILLDL